MNGVQQMYRVLDDLLLYSKHLQITNMDSKPVDLNEVVSEVLSAVRTEGVHPFTVKLEAMPIIQGNADQLTLLFRHLVHNALVFSDKEEARLHIGYYRESRSHLFWVEDNGMGIAPEFHQQIFEPFQRLNRMQHQGTGIGLALCRHIVSLHRGNIWVESGEGRGSRFSFRLPAEKPAPVKQIGQLEKSGSVSWASAALSLN
jgi:chemotaxis family two-component system sensor kinase Cph1